MGRVTIVLRRTVSAGGWSMSVDRSSCSSLQRWVFLRHAALVCTQHYILYICLYYTLFVKNTWVVGKKAKIMNLFFAPNCFYIDIHSLFIFHLYLSHLIFHPFFLLNLLSSLSLFQLSPHGSVLRFRSTSASPSSHSQASRSSIWRCRSAPTTKHSRGYATSHTPASISSARLSHASWNAVLANEHNT